MANVIVWHEAERCWEMATQHAMPFGSVAAVYAWDRLAHAIVHILVTLLRVPIIRYVDDLFGVCFQHQAERVRQYIMELVTVALQWNETRHQFPRQ